MTEQLETKRKQKKCMTEEIVAKTKRKVNTLWYTSAFSLRSKRDELITRAHGLVVLAVTEMWVKNGRPMVIQEGVEGRQEGVLLFTHSEYIQWDAPLPLGTSNVQVMSCYVGLDRKPGGCFGFTGLSRRIRRGILH